jgi:hypothetical protein
MSELGPEARALIDSARDGDDPSELDRARLRNRLGVALAAAATTAAVSAAAPAAATTVASAATATATATKAAIGAQVVAGTQAVVATSVTAKIGVAVTVAVISVAGSGVVLKNELSSSPGAREPAAQVAPRVARVQRRAKAEPIITAPGLALEAPAVMPEPDALIVEAPAPVAPLAPAVVAAKVSTPKKAALRVEASDPAPVIDELPPSMQTEIQLLSFAQGALRDGDYDRALSVLSEHALRFPNGVLALERDAVRAITLCSSGSDATGRVAAEALASRIEGTPLAARLERACK